MIGQYQSSTAGSWQCSRGNFAAFPYVCRRSPEIKYQDACGVLMALTVKYWRSLYESPCSPAEMYSGDGGSGILCKVG
jgi:hypothetical protein